MNKASYEAPARAPKAKATGFKQIVVERLPEQWGLADPIETFKDQGYEIVSEGARRVTMQIAQADFDAREAKVKSDAESRLKSAEGLGKVKQTERSAQEIQESLPDVADLDG
jgi:hypothetical protein